MNSDIHKQLLAIIKALAESDPVYPVTVRPPVPGTPARLDRSFVRKCALCRAVSGHNEENVMHEASCPWIPAKKALALLAAHSPDERKYPMPCGVCPGTIESEQDLEWHGIGNCMPICDACGGSGIEDKGKFFITKKEDAELVELSKRTKFIQSTPAHSPSEEAPASVSHEFFVAELGGVVARGYCHDKNRHKELDSDLLEAIVEELLKVHLRSPSEEAPVRRELELAVIRYKILLDRMAACTDDESGGHLVSAGEVPAWIADARAALAAASSRAGDDDPPPCSCLSQGLDNCPEHKYYFDNLKEHFAQHHSETCVVCLEYSRSKWITRSEPGREKVD